MPQYSSKILRLPIETIKIFSSVKNKNEKTQHFNDCFLHTNELNSEDKTIYRKIISAFSDS